MTEMGEVDHTHPVTDRPFGDLFNATTTLVADGGERAPDEPRPADPDPDDPDDDRGEKMAEVDHESPTGEGIDRVYKRGTSERDDSV